MQPKVHWDGVYQSKPVDTVSWYQEHADCSLRLIKGTGVTATASLIDVGGGASTLVDDLLARHYENVTVADVSSTALMAAKSRLGAHAHAVRWLELDITQSQLPVHAFDVWHDRAVFHFLTTHEDRRTYVQSVLRSVKPEGHVIVATFAEDGPLRCSGLPVMRYNAAELHAEFGAAFTLVAHERELHHTPSGKTQQFTYCYCRKAASSAAT